MKILVIGCGSIGRRHIANLKRIGVGNLTICDADTLRLERVGEEFTVRSRYTDYKKAISESDRVDAAVICTPTSMHLSMALFVAEHKINMMVEKPISTDLEDVDRLLSLVEKNDLILMMAMCYRFHPGLIKLKKLLDEGAIGKIYSVNMYAGYYLPYWHPQADYRVEYSANKSLGGGVILDSIHSLDTIRWLLGEAKEVICFSDKVSNLEIDTEDLASSIFILENGIVVEVHVDYLQRVNKSRTEVIGEKGNIEWDYTRNLIRIFSVEHSKWEEIPYEFDTNDMYVEEMKYFLDCLKHHQKPLMDGSEGKKTLKLAVATRESSRLRRFVGIGQQ